MNRKLVILGSRGMLGQMVRKYFEKQDFDITCFDQRFEYENRLEYSNYLRSLRSSCVINCIGRIKQKTNDANELLSANTILPAELRNALHGDVILIHPSTDCVFSGKKVSPYKVNDLTDAIDDYGWSKRLGEVVLEGRPNTLIPRVSIIGPDYNPGGKGFMAWVNSHKTGTSVNGFTNHLWNGITTLEWCMQVEKFLIENDMFDFKLIQYGTPEYHTKYEMINYLNEIYKLELKVEPVETEIPIDRGLFPDVECKNLFQQLKELKSF